MVKSIGNCFTWAWRLVSRSAVIPDDVKQQVQHVQLERALRHMPMIYAVAIFNILLIMTLCFHREFALTSYGWMGAVAGFCAIRMIQWIARAKSPRSTQNPETMLRGLTFVSIGMISALSGWSLYALSTELFADMTLIPVSLVFGSTCIAHCLAPIKRAAVGVLLIGVVPVASYMLLWGDFDSVMLGTSMLTIVFLMVVFVVESYERIIDGIVMEEKIRRHANSDALTGLANRRAIMAALAEMDAREATPRNSYALALLDLDGFKQVNDSHGHHIGDGLLQIVARRLKLAALPSEFIGRLGGDEFFVLMKDVQDDSGSSARITAFLSTLCRPAEIDGYHIPVSGSMGYALYPRDGASSKALIQAADRALYTAKQDRDGAGNAGHIAVSVRR